MSSRVDEAASLGALPTMDDSFQQQREAARAGQFDQPKFEGSCAYGMEKTTNEAPAPVRDLGAELVTEKEPGPAPYEEDSQVGKTVMGK